MSVSVHASAIVDPSAELGREVTVSPFAIVGPGVTIGDGSWIGPQATIERNTRLGSRVRIGQGTVVGGDPQDLKYRGEETWVEIGDETVIREYSTINRGTSATGRTTVGRKCFLMTYVHLAHDCHLGDGVIIANGTQMAGHVTIRDHATLSGLVVIHQFVTIGEYAFAGGATRIAQDIPPFVKAVGNPMELYGLNTIGLQRAGFPPDTISALKKRARLELPMLPEIERFLAFVETSGRGVPA
jgi:UDP-N-acetylglucosamine acyltransferase